MSLFQKIVIANRGEIAVRVIKTAHKLGIKTVAVFAEDDRNSLHVSQADEAFLFEGDSLQETYLNQEKIIDVALKTGAEAIHPGYGFLSENAAFAQKVENAGLTFIGATPAQIRLMGEKKQSNQFVKKLGVPVIPSVSGSEKEILQAAKKMKFPLLIKASGGGGGKGMEVVDDHGKLAAAMKRTQHSALKYFSNNEIIVEKYLTRARHIEVQIFGDGTGNAIHLFERECSIQRHYQKLTEEAPAGSISENLKEKLYDAALTIARSIKYRGAGTIEFLVDKNENFYFLEMNTRLQVEHPVTELITGTDLVEMQLKTAAGQQINFNQQQITATGCAMELRICAEDPANNFRSTPGTADWIHIPESLRWDSFLQKGATISSAYDSLAGKLIAFGKNRSEVIATMQKKLPELFIAGIKTNQHFFQQVLAHPDFQTNRVHTKWLEPQMNEFLLHEKPENKNQYIPELLAGYVLNHFYPTDFSTSIWKESGHKRIFQTFQIEIENVPHQINVRKKNNSLYMTLNGNSYQINNPVFNGSKISYSINKKDIFIFIFEKDGFSLVQTEGIHFTLRSNHVVSQVKINKKSDEKAEAGNEKVVAGLYGKVVEILVKPGDTLTKGQDLIVIESMKSEITIKSPVAATVKNIQVVKGETVKDEKTLIEFEY